MYIIPFNLARSYEKVEMGKEFRWKGDIAPQHQA